MTWHTDVNICDLLGKCFHLKWWSDSSYYKYPNCVGRKYPRIYLIAIQIWLNKSIECYALLQISINPCNLPACLIMVERLVPIPAGIPVGAIIGKGGSTLRDLTSKSLARFAVIFDHHNDQVVAVRGSATAVDAGEKLLLLLFQLIRNAGGLLLFVHLMIMSASLYIANVFAVIWYTRKSAPSPNVTLVGKLLDERSHKGTSEYNTVFIVQQGIFKPLIEARLAQPLSVCFYCSDCGKHSENENPGSILSTGTFSSSSQCFHRCSHYTYLCGKWFMTSNIL